MTKPQAVDKKIYGRNVVASYYSNENLYVVEASDLGFPIDANQWPSTLWMGDRSFTLDYVKKHSDGEVLHATYTEVSTPYDSGAIIRVFND